MLTQTALQDLLFYDPTTGEFFWRTQHKGKGSRSDLLGKCAGCQHHRGYWDIMIDGSTYRAHRLAWLYVYGRFPKGQLDHINRIKSDNRIANLREATNGQNGANSKPKPSYSKMKGAHWHSRDKRWYSTVWYDGKRISLGRFATAEAAHAAYCKASKKLRGEFFHAGHSK